MSGLDNFIQLNSALPAAPLSINLQNPSNAQVAFSLIEFKAALSAMHTYAPIDISKLQPPQLKPGDCQALAAKVVSLPLSQLEKQAASIIALHLPEPTDDSELKKHKEKTLALAQIAANAVLCSFFSQVFPQQQLKGKPPAKQEVRMVANLPSWKIVKKIDLATSQPKEIFSALAQMYLAVEKKLPPFACNSPSDFDNYLQKLLADVPERRSYSRLQQKLSGLNHSEIAVTCARLAIDQKLAPTLIELVYLALFERCGFPPYASAETIGTLYPELKIPKPRGNWHRKER